MPRSPAAVSPRSRRLHVYLLGAFRLEREKMGRAPRSTTHRHTEPLSLPTRKTQSLLAFLILHPEPHTREQLATLFWGEVPDDLARSSLRRALVLLHRSIGSDIILADRASIQLNPAFPLWVDVREFQTQAEDFLRSGKADLPIHLALYQDNLLADLDDLWIEPWREHLRSLYVRVVLTLAQQHRARAEYAHAIDLARQLLRADPANESAHQNIMFCEATLGHSTAALQQFAVCERALQEELGIAPSPETIKLVEWIRAQQTSTGGHASQITNLPMPLTSFIGREREIGDIKGLLQTIRLLTLTGAGGCGKTRLAIQVATEIMDQFKDGVWWVDFAGLREGAYVADTVAQTLGVREVPHRSFIETLTGFLQTKQLLLILDNCEHLLEACARLCEALLTRCPRLRILATSRQAFNIVGETAWILPSLALPAVSVSTPQQVKEERLVSLGNCEAVRLFVERARAVKPDFGLTERNAVSVAQICERLDGIPLALELAAARIKLLTAEHLAARLHDRFNLLSTSSPAALPRHQTLRACVDWSYEPLPAEARALFRRLSVFMSGFTLEAAQAVCSGEDLGLATVLDHLSRLIDRSLVNVEPQKGNRRFYLLETIREYGSEKLREAGEADITRQRHLEWFLALAEAAEPELHGRNQGEWLARLETEHDNLRWALRWSVSGDRDAHLGIRLACALVDFWELRCHFTEGQQWLEASLKQDAADQRWRAKALQGAGALASHQDVAAARLLLAESVAIYRELGDRIGLAYSLYKSAWPALNQSNLAAGRSYLEEGIVLLRSLKDRLGLAYALDIMAVMTDAQGEWAAARPIAEESLSIFRELGDKYGMILALQDLGLVMAELGDSDQARALLEESLALCREIGSSWDIGRTTWSLGWVARHEHDYALARYWYGKSLKHNMQLGYDIGMAYTLNGFGTVAAAEAQFERAGRLLGAVKHLNDQLALRFVPVEQAWYHSSIEIVRTALGEAGLARALAEGRAMAQGQAIEYALEGDT